MPVLLLLFVFFFNDFVCVLFRPLCEIKAMAVVIASHTLCQWMLNDMKPNKCWWSMKKIEEKKNTATTLFAWNLCRKYENCWQYIVQWLLICLFGFFQSILLIMLFPNYINVWNICKSNRNTNKCWIYVETMEPMLQPKQ